MKIKVVLEPAEEGGYTVYVPSLSGCISEGDTFEEAIANLKKSIELYIECKDDQSLKHQELQIKKFIVSKEIRRM